jgi:hypothetical protein
MRSGLRALSSCDFNLMDTVSWGCSANHNFEREIFSAVYVAPASRRRVFALPGIKKNAGKMPAPQFAGRTISKPSGFFSRSKV